MKPEETLGTLMNADANADGRGAHAPLADKVRPKNLAEFVGQEHLVGLC